ncbi:hypothetical protein D3C72_1956350 [compost metagenome]
MSVLIGLSKSDVLFTLDKPMSDLLITTEPILPLTIDTVSDDPNLCHTPAAKITQSPSANVYDPLPKLYSPATPVL